MKRLFPLCISLVAASACTPQSPFSPFAGTSPSVQVAVAAAPAHPILSANTTSAYDGTYAGVAIENVSAGNAMAEAGEGLSTCVNYGAPPALTISKGLAQVQAFNHTFEGYVTPQGALTMRTGHGEKFEGQIGQINNQYVLTGRMVGLCTYNLSWQQSNLIGISSSLGREGQ